MTPYRVAAVLVTSLVALGAVIASSTSAEAQRMCRSQVCVKRAPFVCQGPIGSCGFAQGKCLRYATTVVRCGRPPVVR